MMESLGFERVIRIWRADHGWFASTTINEVKFETACEESPQAALDRLLNFIRDSTFQQGTVGLS